MPTYPFKRDGHAWSSGEKGTAALLNGLTQACIGMDLLASDITSFHTSTVIVKCNEVDVTDSRIIRVSVEGTILLGLQCTVTAKLWWSASAFRTWNFSHVGDVTTLFPCVFSGIVFPGAPDTTSTWLTLETDGANIGAVAGFRIIAEDIGSSLNLIAT